jgi:hypothetical protein
LWEVVSWGTWLWVRLAGSNILLCQCRLSGLIFKGWAPRTKGCHLIYPCEQVTEAKAKCNPYMVIFNFIGYFILVLLDFPLPGEMWPSSCSDFSGLISLLCHPYLPATFSGLRSSLFSSDPPPCYVNMNCSAIPLPPYDGLNPLKPCAKVNLSSLLCLAFCHSDERAWLIQKFGTREVQLLLKLNLNLWNWFMGRVWRCELEKA